jgi:hypothetical protein
VPKLRPNALPSFLERTNNWKLRTFTALALDADRFEKFLPVAGIPALSKLALEIVEPNHGVEIAEMIAATNNREIKQRLARVVIGEWTRVHQANDRSGEILYGLLAARLLRGSVELPGLRDSGAPYLSLLESSAVLDTGSLFDAENRCVQRYFFWDDDDGVQSFANFRRGYEHDPAWKIEDRAEYVHLTGGGAGGRTIEIFANIPIDIRLPANREREGEAQRRQSAIALEMTRRGLTTTVLVHRGHSFHLEKTLAYVTPDARLVVLGSCRGVSEIHRVIEVSHRAQTIATRAVGATEINDSILKQLNQRLLSSAAPMPWRDFWRDVQSRAGRSAILRSYVTPDRDESAAFLRGYYQALTGI